MKKVKDFLSQNPINQVFQKPKNTKLTPKIHGKLGHNQADLTFLTRYQRQIYILLVVINVNTKFAYVAALKDKTQETVLNALDRIRQKSINDGRPLKVLQTDNGKEFQNARIKNWIHEHNISSQYCEKENKKCLGVEERFNRTIKLIIEKYLTSKNTNRWVDKLQDFVQNYNSSFHSSISKIPEQLEMFDEAELIRKSIAHNNKVSDSAIKRGDFVRLLSIRERRTEIHFESLYSRRSAAE
jgi:transposase InsO family protein